MPSPDAPFLFEEIEDDLEVPEWRGRSRCVWRKCPGRFEVAAVLGGRVELLRCSGCWHEHISAELSVTDE